MYMVLSTISSALLTAATGISSRIHAIADALPGGDDDESTAGAAGGDGLRLSMDRFKQLEKLRRRHPRKYAALLSLSRSRPSPGLREPQEVVKARVINVLR